MADQLPPPPVPADCDCTDLDGFMLNVERLMASELVALSSHEVIGASLFLWCRAWKQRPAGSLPDDERVLAAYARLPLPRFRRLREDAMRGFVKCSDGRFYHRVLSVEALKAYEKKLAFQNRRNGDAERLRKWRKSRSETPAETTNETRFVAEGQGQGQGQGQVMDRDKTLTVETPSGSPPPPPVAAASASEMPSIPDFLRRGSAPIARSIAPDWMPSQSAEEALAKARPDLTPELVRSRMVEFRTWCVEKSIQTHNADASWFGFMSKTRIPNGQQHRGSTDGRPNGGSPTVSDGISAAFARRSVPAGG